jgi:NAD+ kinase
MKWGIVGKGAIPHVKKGAAAAANLLATLGQDVQLESSLDATHGRSMDDMNADVDMFVTVGGDGTILHAQQHTDKPVFGINAGAVGFLAEIEPEHMAPAFARIIAGDYRVEARPKLATTLDGNRLPDAVNEVTLQTSRIAKLIRFRVDVDGENVDTYRGDGIIVSTATGSTGYAMSVGGPLLHPRVSGIVLAPIAPFRLAARPWVVPDDAKVAVTLLRRDSAQGLQQARVVVDGQHGCDVATGATLQVATSENVARYVRLGTGFYERVRTKLTR